MQVTHYKQECPQDYVTVQLDADELHDIRMAVMFVNGHDELFDKWLHQTAQGTKSRGRNFHTFLLEARIKSDR